MGLLDLRKKVSVSSFIKSASALGKRGANEVRKVWQISENERVQLHRLPKKSGGSLRKVLLSDYRLELSSI